MAMSDKNKSSSKFAALGRQWWRLHLCQKLFQRDEEQPTNKIEAKDFFSGTKSRKTEYVVLPNFKIT